VGKGGIINKNLGGKQLGYPRSKLVGNHPQPCDKNGKRGKGER
jgi:hypothetical protein